MKLSQRNVSLISIFGLTALILAEFQNCAPAGGPTSSQALTSPSGSVKVIEDLNKSQIQFVIPEFQVEDAAQSVSVDGLCNQSHEGSVLRWTLSVSEGQAPLAEGFSQCQRGQFSVTLQAMDQVVCGEAHRLSLRSDWGDLISTKIIKRCQPLASEKIEPPVGFPAGTECSIEYSASSQSLAESPCTQVCYRENIVMSQASVDVSQCSSLIAKLSGR